MPSRLILMPNQTSFRQGPDGREEVHTPDFEMFDVKPDAFAVKTDYRDVSKVLVTLPEKPLRELAQRTQAYFDQLWKRPNAEDGADAG